MSINEQRIRLITILLICLVMMVFTLRLSSVDLVPRRWLKTIPAKGASIRQPFTNPHNLPPNEQRKPFTNNPQVLTLSWDWAVPTNDIAYEYRYPTEFTVEKSTDLSCWESCAVTNNADRVVVALDAAPMRFFRVWQNWLDYRKNEFAR